MTVLATLDEPRFRVARWEVDRVGPTYAVDTLRVARQALAAEPGYGGPPAHGCAAPAEPGHGRPIELAWVIGTDAMALIHTWYDVRGLFEATSFLVVARTGYDEAGLRAELARTVPWAPAAAVRFVAMPPVDVSSTAIRTRLGRGEVAPEVPAPVFTYIRRYGLYRQAAGVTG